MRARLRSFWLVSLVLLAPAARAQAPSGGAADPKALAKEWANKAHERFQAGDYQGAADAMAEAQKHARPPTFVRFLAQVNEKLGRLMEAERLYREVAETTLPRGAPEPFKKAQAEAKKELTLVGKRVPTLTLAVSGAPAGTWSVYVDGKPVSADEAGRGVRLDPGKHTLIVEAKGRDRVSREVVLKEGATEKVNIEVPPAPPEQPTPGIGAPSAAPAASAPPSPKPPAAVPMPPGSPAPAPAAPSPWLTAGKFAALGLGAAGIGVGAATGGLVLGELDTLRNGPCDPTLKKCDRRDEAGVEQVRTLADVSTAGFVIGGVFAAAGVVLLLLPPPRRGAPAVGVAVNGTGFVMTGGF